MISIEPEAKAELFEVIAAEWFTSIKTQVKESTSNKYWNLLNSYILPKFGKTRLSEITYDCVCEQCNQLLETGGKKGTGLSAKTVSDILSLIRNILQFAIQRGMTVACDAHSIHVKSQTKEMRVLSRSEQEKLCKYIFPRFAQQREKTQYPLALWLLPVKPCLKDSRYVLLIRTALAQRAIFRNEK